MSALVIKAWRVDTKPIDDQRNFVSIAGREGGPIAWLLSLMRIDPTTRIQIGLDRLEFVRASLAGTESRIVPLQNICSTYYGYHKPWKAAAAILGVFLLIGYQISSFAACGAIGAVIALIYYFLNRTLTLGFVEVSGSVLGIRFKRSVIENLDVDEHTARSLCALVQRLMEVRQRRALLAASATVPMPAAVQG